MNWIDLIESNKSRKHKKVIFANGIFCSYWEKTICVNVENAENQREERGGGGKLVKHWETFFTGKKNNCWIFCFGQQQTSPMCDDLKPLESLFTFSKVLSTLYRVVRTLYSIILLFYFIQRNINKTVFFKLKIKWKYHQNLNTKIVYNDERGRARILMN